MRIDLKLETLEHPRLSNNMRQETFERQKCVCPACKKHFLMQMMEGDRILPLTLGGKSTADNCQMLYKAGNTAKMNL